MPIGTSDGDTYESAFDFERAQIPRSDPRKTIPLPRSDPRSTPLEQEPSLSQEDRDAVKRQLLLKPFTGPYDDSPVDEEKKGLKDWFQREQRNMEQQQFRDDSLRDEDTGWANRTPPMFREVADVNRGRPIPQSESETEGARGLVGGSAKALRQKRLADAERIPDPDEKIDKVAVRFTRNNHIEADRGVIHGELVDRIADKFRLKYIPYQEVQSGYLTNKGNFVTREQALQIATRQKQLSGKNYSTKWGELMSEDLPGIGGNTASPIWNTHPE